ncbi:MAG: S8 family serine peptidase [Verrucomicrobiae bacterium]|nr:S8 family serine peptidase [Verrucomicrobiae bacterium]
MIWICCPGLLVAAWKDEIGYTQLQEVLGEALPDGSGVRVVMVEANAANAPSYLYLPNGGNSEFDGKTMTDASGLSTGFSSHATGVASIFFGNSTSFTPGIVEISTFLSDDWMDASLNTGATAAPSVIPGQVINHSWVSAFSDSSYDTYALNVLARFDLAIDRDQVTAVVGLNNGSGNPQPQLLTSGYNSLSVGLTNGNHSRGFSTFAGLGRMKPEIVAPMGTTSNATPVVSSIAALLRQVANSHASPTAIRPEVIKACLMAGATKEEFPNWSHTEEKPLDAVFGAGEVNVYNSYFIMSAPEQSPDSLVAEKGWDYGQVSTTNRQQVYFLNVAEGQLLLDLSVMLTWHRDVSVSRFNNTSSLDNLSLQFYEADNQNLGNVIATSDSPVDNVEHLYLPDPMEPGEYALVVNGPGGESFQSAYGLAWRSSIRANDNYDLWRYLQFAESELPLEDRAADQDPDFDEMDNRMEYALGSDPEVAEPQGSVVQMEILEFDGQSYLALHFKRRRFVSDLRYEVAFSEDMTNWDSSDAALIEQDVTVLDASYERVTYRTRLPVNFDSSLFLRLSLLEI